MYIRKTKVKTNRNSDTAYYTYRIVESERIGDSVKQRTLLNLGKYFDVDPTHWSWLTARIIGRLVFSPSSERCTLQWLKTCSALGELIDHDFHTTSLTRLYQVTDQLLKNKESIE